MTHRNKVRIHIDAMSIYGIGLIIYFATASIYVFPSGLPQPGDYLIAAASGFLLLTSFAIGRSYKAVVFFSFLFVLYAFCISAIWAALVSDPDMLRIPAYYLFNFVVFLSLIVAASRAPERTLTLLKYAAIAGVTSLIAQFVLTFDFSLRRQSLGFNNPNQLAYFSLCLCAILLLLRHAGVLTFNMFAVLYAACSVPLLVSFSATALVAWLFSLTIILFTQFRRSALTAIAVVVVFALAGWILYAFSSQETYFGENLSYRISRIDDKTQNIAAQRGYDRIFEFAQYTIFGAGEAARWRFGDYGIREIHSTVGTLIFSYGIVGTALFVGFLLSALRGAGMVHYAVLAIPFLYALTHQGLRTTLFWLLLAALAICVADMRKRKRRAKKAPSSSAAVTAPFSAQTRLTESSRSDDRSGDV